jgi:hypothetical protein
MAPINLPLRFLINLNSDLCSLDLENSDVDDLHKIRLPRSYGDSRFRPLDPRKTDIDLSNHTGFPDHTMIQISAYSDQYDFDS